MGKLILTLLLACHIGISSFAVRVERTVVEVNPPTLLVGKPMEVEEITLPVCHVGINKTYMDYGLIATESNQGKYIAENMTVKDGLLYDKDGNIGVALGSYFGAIGSKYTFVLSSGVELRVVKIEAKADRHTINGCYQKWDKSVIEFVIDTEHPPFPRSTNGYIAGGNFNNVPQFKGSIVKIIKR